MEEGLKWGQTNYNKKPCLRKATAMKHDYLAPCSPAVRVKGEMAPRKWPPLSARI